LRKREKRKEEKGKKKGMGGVHNEKWGKEEKRMKR
jgi:hypothetical protein